MDERDRRSLYERVTRLETRMEQMESASQTLERIFWSTLLIVGFTAVAALVMHWFGV